MDTGLIYKQPKERIENEIKYDFKGGKGRAQRKERVAKKSAG